MGQLLVVAHHTDTSPSLCYGPELIPDPASQALTTVNCGIWDQELIWQDFDFEPYTYIVG